MMTFHSYVKLLGCSIQVLKWAWDTSCGSIRRLFFLGTTTSSSSSQVSGRIAFYHRRRRMTWHWSSRLCFSVFCCGSWENVNRSSQVWHEKTSCSMVPRVCVPKTNLLTNLSSNEHQFLWTSTCTSRKNHSTPNLFPPMQHMTVLKSSSALLHIQSTEGSTSKDVTTKIQIWWSSVSKIDPYVTSIHSWAWWENYG